ncbi:MAG: RNA polymerase sigma-70 factor [Paramuribaculum sp.]|nr:RNA polymerase sigma-70 factor [Paramuribaculum sp.]MDE7151775.1 RNA polymerase sigma-70 factor [Candidatus Amulumruptor sp.]
MPNELHLIDRLRQSDYDAFSTLYRRYSPRVYHTVLRMFGNADVAADVVQDLFLKIWEKRADMDPSGNFEAYIHVVARNLAYSYLRNELDKLENISTAEAAAMCAGGDDPSKELEAMSTGEFIRRIIDSMPPVRRQIFIMSRFDNLSHKEIAARMNISERTVESHIYQALKIIHKSLGLFAVALLPAAISV